jgi:aspartate kinase
MDDIVCKFGGTSVADASQIRKMAAILESDPRRRFIVPSAPGKRDGKDQKITDLLYLCHEMARQGLDFRQPFELICERYRSIAEELDAAATIDADLAEVGTAITGGASRDFVASRGEYLNGRILAAYLGARFVDPKEAVLIGDDGRLRAETYDRLGVLLQGVGRFVVPGFYGTDPRGNIKTFSRGGSDLSGAIVARAAGAAIYENWTDVSGFLMADPRIVLDAQPIREITYRELRELAYMGASVLHDEAIFPVRERRIPIHILNTNAPDDPGTRIVADRDATRSTVVGIAGLKGFTAITVEKALLNKERGFGRKFLEIIEGHGISFEHLPTGIDSISVVIRDEELIDKTDGVIGDVRRILEPDRVDVIPDLALLAVVGEGMAYRVGVAARVFGALAAARVNVRLMNQGSSEISIFIGVANDDLEASVRALHGAFVGE